MLVERCRRWWRGEDNSIDRFARARSAMGRISDRINKERNP